MLMACRSAICCRGRPCSVLIAQAGNQSRIAHGPCRGRRGGQTGTVAGVKDSTSSRIDGNKSRGATYII